MQLTLSWALSLLSATASHAFTVTPPYRFMGSEAVAVQQLQDSGWRSPKTLSPDFPALDGDECARYGAQYNYIECRYARKSGQAKLEKQKASVEKPEAAVRTAALNAPVESSQAGKRREARPKTPADIKPTLQVPAEPVLTTLQKRMGALLLTSFDGKARSDDGVLRVTGALKRGEIGGVILEAGNVDGTDQLRALVRTILESGSSGPAIVAVSRPGGLDNVLPETKGFTFYAPPSSAGNVQAPYVAQVMYEDMGAELAGLGINLNLGPSGDVCPLEEDRSLSNCFGASAAHVAAFVTAFNFGHHEKGVATAVRYRTGSPVLASAPGKRANTAILDEVSRREASDAIVAEPFGAATSPTGARKSLVLEAAGAQAMLRPHGFDGVVIADLDFAILGPVRIGETIVNAVSQGADMIAIRHAPDETARRAIDALSAAVADGRLTVDDLDRSYRRVETMKRRFQSPRLEASTNGVQRSESASAAD